MTADVSLINKGKQSLPLLAIDGYFMLDDHVRVDASAILLDKIIGLGPGQMAHMRFTGKIPYTYDFKTITVHLRDTQKSTDIIEFANITGLSPVPSVAENGKLRLEGTGRRFELSARTVDTFQGKASDIYSVQLELRNLEQRYTENPILSALFQAADGTIFPAELETVKSKSRSGGSSIVQAWTTIPKIRYGRHAPDDLNIDPYSLTISYVSYPSIYYNKTAGAYELTFYFDYDYTQDFLLQANVSNHRYLIEIVDADGKVLVSKPVLLQEDPAAANTGSAYEIGSGTMEIKQNIEGLSFNTSAYTLNIYDQFQSGYKKLLASKKLN